MWCAVSAMNLEFGKSCFITDIYANSGKITLNTKYTDYEVLQCKILYLNIGSLLLALNEIPTICLTSIGRDRHSQWDTQKSVC